ncbi:MAG: hypothetical protein NTU97_03525, partial [Candidatus Magasanikbacteria bacterium]|nr:hypothetical protein [Candidatus Magasanikbacteria bacterium]
MNKRLQPILLIVILLIVGGGVYLFFYNSVKDPLVSKITYLVSSVDSLKYCNGADMDSAGYQKTITVEKSTNLLEINPTKAQLIKTVINAATTGMCQSAMDQLSIMENGGVVTIPPINAWAGVSITMCSCQPLVEVNLLKIPGITKVVWSNELKIDSGVEGVVTLGPTCPVVRVGDTTCADKPYATTVQVIAVGSPKSSPFVTVKTDALGYYEIMVPPGDYALQPVGGTV